MTVTVDLLGILSVRRNGIPVALTPAEQELAAVLFSAPGRIQTHPDIEERLWGRSHPEHSRIRQLVHALRNKIDGGAPVKDSVIATINGRGFRADLDAEAVDSVRFTRAARHASTLRGQGDHRAALERCRIALAGWPDDAAPDGPLAGLRSPWSDEFREEHRKQRLDVLECLAECEAEAGNHRLALGVWERLAAARPESDRVVLGHLRALRLLGELRAAAAVYHDYRDLAKELGMDPNPELLRELQLVHRAGDAPVNAVVVDAEIVRESDDKVPATGETATEAGRSSDTSEAGEAARPTETTEPADATTAAPKGSRHRSRDGGVHISDSDVHARDIIGYQVVGTKRRGKK